MNHILLSKRDSGGLWRRRLAMTSALAGLLLLPVIGADAQPDAAQNKNEVKADAEAKAEPDERAAVRGRLVRVPLPITGNVDRRVVQQIRRALLELKPDTAAAAERRPVLILEFSPGQTEFGLGSEFEDSLKLARFLISSELDGVKTVAFVPRSIKGHALLVAMACEQIAMLADTEIGDAGAGHDEDNPIDATITGGYEQIARSRRTVPVAVALGMLDPALELLRVETEDGPQLVLARDLAALRENKTIDEQQTRVIFAAGEPGLLSARQARDLGVATYVAADRQEIAGQLGLPRAVMRGSSFLDRDLRARRIMIDRVLDAKLAETRLRMIDDAVGGERVNFICLWIDSPGGDAAAAARLASYLAELDSDEVLTVAYVPGQARGTAALVALACDDVLMHADAVLGGGEEDLDDEQLLDVLAVIDDEIAPQKLRSASLMAALFKDDLVVHRYRNRRSGRDDYFSEEEFSKRQDQDDWQRGQQIGGQGAPLEVDGLEAENLGLATAVVDDFAGLKKQYGLEDDPALSEPNWVDELVRALASPGLAWLLLLIGLAGMYAELQMPGIGAGGFVAALAFTLFFWSNFLEGTAGALEIVLFLVGISCLVMEVFIIPGFGIFGLGGGAMILASLILASQTFVLPSSNSEVRELRDSLLVVGGAVVGMVALAAVMRRYLPHTPFLNRLMLPNPESNLKEERADREALVDYRHLVGTRGRATTQLTPSGKARFDDELVDVVSEGDLIPINSTIEVIEVHGNRVVVKQVE